MAVWPWLFHSQTWLPLTRRSVSPKETGTAILTWRGPSYQMSTVCVPLMNEAALNTDDCSPAMLGSDGKPRLAFSVITAVNAVGGLASRMATSNCAGVRLGSVGPAAFASIVPASTPAATMTAAADVHPALLRNIRRGLIALPPSDGRPIDRRLVSRYPSD